MYTRNNKTYLSHYNIKEKLDLLVTSINNRDDNIHLIGLARGSFNLIQELSNRCNLEYTILQYSAYNKDDKEIKFGFSSESIKPTDILFIIDDIADTGNSINKTSQYLKDKYSNKKIEVYTIVGNGDKFPDWNYGYNHNEFEYSWTVFPYESNIKEQCNKCLLGVLCNEDLNKTHCNKFNKSFLHNHSCKEFK